MKTNWVERLWIDGPWRIPFQVNAIRSFKRLHDMAPPRRVLEIGCGRGVGARLILEAFRPERLEAVDIDPAMIRRARRRLAPELGSRLVFQVADAEALPFPDRSMDAVFNFGIMHHLEDWNRGVREIARMLKPEGVFYFEEFYPALYAGPVFKHVLVHPRENRFDGPQFRSALEGEGLRLVEGYRETRYSIIGAATRLASGG